MKDNTYPHTRCNELVAANRATAATLAEPCTVEQLVTRARLAGFCVNGRLQVAPEAVAALLGVKTRRLRRWRLENFGPLWDISDYENIVYKLDDLARWVNERAGSSAVAS